MNTLRSVSTNASAFLWTELKSKNKPLLLSVADKILSPFNYTEICSDGLPSKQERDVSDKDIVSFGFGVLCAYTFSGSLVLSTFPALVSYTVGSLSAKVFIEILCDRFKGYSFQKNRVINRILTMSAIFIGGVLQCVLHYKIFKIVSNLFSSSNLSFISSIYLNLATPLMATLLVIKCIAFNFFVGEFLKFIAYKIYPTVQKSYDNFFSLIKAGTKDSRANKDVALFKHYAKSAIPTNFNYIPLEIFSQIMQDIPSQSGLQMRLSCKGLFSKISNRDILEKKIAHSFNIAYNRDSCRYEIRPELLNLFYNHPLRSSLMPLYNFNPWRPKTLSLAQDKDIATKIIDYCITNKNSLHWGKNFKGDLILVKKGNFNNITFTNRYTS